MAMVCPSKHPDISQFSAVIFYTCNFSHCSCFTTVSVCGPKCACVHWICSRARRQSVATQVEMSHDSCGSHAGNTADMSSPPQRRVRSCRSRARKRTRS